MSDASPPWITLLTPSWNRAHLLPRLHRSIKEAQPAGLALEWLLVDDGSVDDTSRLCQEWAADPLLRFRFIRVPHGGKHRALYAGFAAARGDWIVIIDSDDWLFQDGLANIAHELSEADARSAQIALLPMEVVGARRQFGFERPSRAVTVQERLDSEPPFDATRAIRRDLAVRRSPQIAGEDFLAEAAIFDGVPQETLLYLSARTCVFVEYQRDGLSANMLQERVGSPMGASLCAQIILSRARRPGLKWRSLANYARFWWHTLRQGKAGLPPTSILQALVLPLGLPIALFDLWRTRRRR